MPAARRPHRGTPGSAGAAAPLAMEVLTSRPLPVTGELCPLSGIVLGLGSKRACCATGRVLTPLVPTVLWCSRSPREAPRPAERARRVAAGELLPLDVGSLVHPPIVSPPAPLVAMTLSVVPPRGRVRRPRQPA